MEQIQCYSHGSALLTRFLKSPVLSPPFYDPSYNEIDRIVSYKQQKYQVKWVNLGYDEMTCETEVSPEALAAFQTRKQLSFPAVGVTARPNPTIEWEIFTQYEIGDSVLDPFALSTLNLFLADYCEKDPPEIASHFSQEVQVACSAIIHFLITATQDTGPYLIITPSGAALSWYNCLRKLPNAVTLGYFGTKDSRTAAIENGFISKKKTLKFHILVTTQDIFTNDSELWRGIRWRMAVLDGVKGLRNGQSKFAKLMMEVPIGFHILLGRSAPRVDDVQTLVDLLITDDARARLPKDIIESAIRARQAIQSRLQKRKFEPGGYQTHFVDCPLTEYQRGILRRTIASSGQAIRSGDFVYVCRKILRICTHPFLLSGVEFHDHHVDLLAASMKLSVVDSLLQNIGSDTFLIVSSFSLMLDLVEDVLNTREIDFVRLEGNLNDGETAPVFLFDPQFAALPNNILDRIDYVIVIDGDSPEFIHELQVSKSLRLSRVYYLQCRDCSEAVLQHVCAYGPLQTDTDRCEKICQLSALAAMSEREPPPPPELLARATIMPRTANPQERLGAELSNCDFWSFILDPKPPEVVCPIFEGGNELPRHVWTTRERNQLLRSVTRFGWGRWDDLMYSGGLGIEKGAVVCAGRALLRELLRSATTTRSHALAREFLSHLEHSESDADLDNAFLDQSVFGEERFRSRVAAGFARILHRIEVLAGLESFAGAKSSDEIQLPHAFGAGPADWWTGDHDRLLLLACVRYGVGCYDRIPEDNGTALLKIFGSEGAYIAHSLLTDRVIQIAEELQRLANASLRSESVSERRGRRRFDKAAPDETKSSQATEPETKRKRRFVEPSRKFKRGKRAEVPQKPRRGGNRRSKRLEAEPEPEPDDSESPQPRQPKSHSDDEPVAPPSPEATRVVQHILRFGIDETPGGDYDWAKFGEACELSDRTPSEIRDFTEAVCRGVSAQPGEYGVTPRKANHLEARKEGLHGLRSILRNEEKLTEIIAGNHWRGFPSRFLPEHEILFFREFLNAGFGHIDEVLQAAGLQDMVGDKQCPVQDLAIEHRIHFLVQEFNQDHKQKVQEEVPTKPKLPAAAAIARGFVTYPLVLSKDCLILDLGAVESTNTAFFTERYIFPVGFSIQRPFGATAEGAETEIWRAKIVKDDDKPLFVLSPCSNPQREFSGRTPQAACEKMREELGIAEPVNGIDMFMLDDPDVIYCIEGLKNVRHCQGYVRRVRKVVEQESNEEALRRQASRRGGARPGAGRKPWKKPKR